VRAVRELDRPTTLEQPLVWEVGVVRIVGTPDMKMWVRERTYLSTGGVRERELTGVKLGR